MSIIVFFIIFLALYFIFLHVHDEEDSDDEVEILEIIPETTLVKKNEIDDEDINYETYSLSHS